MPSANDVRAGGAFVELYAKDLTTKAFQTASANLKKLGQIVTLIGATVAAAGTAVTAPLIYGLTVASEWASELSGGARRTGIEFERLGGLAYALRTDMDGLAAATGHMDQLLQQAADGSVEANSKLQALGLTFEELNGLSQAERILKFADALDKVGDAGQRIALQRAIFGRQGAGLDIRGGAEGIRKRETRGANLGANMSEKDLAIISQYNAATRDLGVVTKATWASIGVAIAPVMTDFIQLVTGVVSGIKNWVDNNRPLIATVFEIADKCVLAGAAITGIGGALLSAGFAVSYLTGAGVAFVSFLFSAANGLGFVTLASWALSASWTALTAMASFAAGGFGVFTAASWISAAAIAAFEFLLGAGSAVLALFTGEAVAAGVGSSVFSAGLSLGAVAASALEIAIAFLDAALAAYDAGVLGAFLGTVAWKAVTWLASAAMSALGISTAGTGAAVTVATGGVNLLIVALIGLAVVAAAVGIAMGGAIPFALIGVAAYLLSSIGAVNSSLSATTNVAMSMAGTLGNAAAMIGESFGTMFSGLVSTGSSAFSALKDALKTGDFEMAWEIIKVAAELAWIDIADFAMKTWIDSKAAFFSIMAQLGDYLSDVFEDAWADAKGIFAIGWGMIKAGFLNLAADIIGALSAPMQTIRTMLSALAKIPGVGAAAKEAIAALDAIDNSAGQGALHRSAQEALRGGADQARDIHGERNAQRQADEISREQREQERERQRLQERADAEQDPAKRQDLMEQLEGLREGASLKAMGDPDQLDKLDKGSAGFEGKKNAETFGSFSASAFQGLAGSGVQTKEDKTADRLEEVKGVLNRILEAIQAGRPAFN